MALFGDRERELIKSGFGFGLDLTGGMAWHDGYLTKIFNQLEILSNPKVRLKAQFRLLNLRDQNFQNF